MKKLSLLLFAILPLTGFGQENEPANVMFEIIYLDPVPGKAIELESGVKTHNERFHTAGNEPAYLYSVVTGPRSGQYLWTMGPVTYAVFDNPSPEGHAGDWEKNVAAYCKQVAPIQLWKRNEQLSYNPENELAGEILVVRIYKVKNAPRNLEAMKDVVGKMKEVFDAQKYDRAARVYISEFRSDTGEDLIVVYSFPNWKAMENDKGLPPGFEAAFDVQYGRGSWARTLEVMLEHSDGWYDEVRVRIR